MGSGFGHSGFASNLHSNAFGSFNKVPFPASECTSTDITLRLDSPGTSTLYGSSSIGFKRKWANICGTDGTDNTFLSLGLGWPSSSSDNSKGSSATVCTISSAKEITDEGSSMELDLNFQLHLGNENTFSPKNHSAPTGKAIKTGPICDLQLSLSTGPSESVITNLSPVSAQQQSSPETSLTASPVQTNDEEVSTVSGWQFGVPSPSLDKAVASSGLVHYQNTSEANPPMTTTDQPSTMTEKLKNPVTCTSGVTHVQTRNSSTKTCQFQGCVKGARGASGLCIAHGGGRRCQKPGCHKGAEGRTVYCKAHGGGRRCQFLGCTKSAEGRTDFCIAHGGGRRCSHEGCIRAARGKSGLCIRHGGGKRCQVEKCTKSAEGYSGLCISHGGGRRCQYPQCNKGAQGSTLFCKAHGGGKRCTAPGCTKGAEGSTPFCKGHGGGKRCSFHGGGVCPKSVHGGTLFCVAHGGGKRCAVSECTKSARGRTDYCVRHGGGKRCRFDGCGKSAQGSTDFCKAHGGGKRCSWGHGGSADPGAGGPPCDRFARGKTGLCASHGALIQDHCIHGGGTLGPAAASQLQVSVKPEMLKAVTMKGNLFSKSLSKESYVAWNIPTTEKFVNPMIAFQSVTLPEGRVHGGNLMAFLSGGAGAGSQLASYAVSADTSEAGTSKQGSVNSRMHHWV